LQLTIQAEENDLVGGTIGISLRGEQRAVGCLVGFPINPGKTLDFCAVRVH
jgi:hypothetical protein